MSVLETVETLIRVIENGRLLSDCGLPFKVEIPREIARHYDETLEKIRGDRNLTPAGKKAARIEATKNAFAEIQTWKERTVDVLSGRVEMETEALTSKSEQPKIDPTDRLISELRGQEIRKSLGDPDPLKAEILFLSGDAEVRQALASAPPQLMKTPDGEKFVPLISKEVKERFALAEAKAKDPDAVQEIGNIRKQRDDYQSVAGTLTAELEKSLNGTGATLRDDPIAERAKGIGTGVAVKDPIAKRGDRAVGQQYLEAEQIAERAKG